MGLNDPDLISFIPEIAVCRYIKNRSIIYPKQDSDSANDKRDNGLDYFLPKMKIAISKTSKYFKKKIDKERAAVDLSESLLEQVLEESDNSIPQ